MDEIHSVETILGETDLRFDLSKVYVEEAPITEGVIAARINKGLLGLFKVSTQHTASVALVRRDIAFAIRFFTMGESGPPLAHVVSNCWDHDVRLVTLVG